MAAQKTPQASSFRKKIIYFLVALLLAFLTVSTVLKGGKISPEELKNGMQDIFVPGLLAALGGMIGFIFFEGAALAVIVRALGYPVKYRRGFVYSAADIYFSAITPSASGGQPASAFFMIQDGIPATVVMVSLLLNLIMYTMAVISVGLVAMILFPGIFLQFNLICKGLILLGIITLTALSILFYLLLRRQALLQALALGIASILKKLHFHHLAEKIHYKLDHIIEEFSECVTLLFNKKKLLVQVYLLNLFQRLSQLLVTVFSFVTIHGNLSKLADLFATQIYVVLGSNSVPIPGSMGVADYLMLNGYMELMSIEQAYHLEIISRGISFYACTILSMITAGIGYIILKRKHR